MGQKKGMISSWTLVGWWQGKWESALSAVWFKAVWVSCLCAAYKFTSSTWWNICIHKTAHIFLMGNRILPQIYTIISLDYSSCLCIPSFPWLATIWTCSLELRKIMEGWAKPVSCNQEMGGHRKAFVPRSPTGWFWCLVSRVPWSKDLLPPPTSRTFTRVIPWCSGSWLS